MAKKPIPKKGESVPASDAQKKIKTARIMLALAVVLSVVSLGGGFYFARYAFQRDAQEFEAEVVEDAEDIEQGAESAAEEPAGEDAPKSSANEAGAGDESEGEAGDDTDTLGFLDFADLTTNITGFDLNGRPVRSFLKLSVVLVYTPEPGAEELMISRQPFARDLFNAYIRSLTEADVRGGAGILMVKAELLRRARAAVGNDWPQEILINDLIVN